MPSLLVLVGAVLWPFLLDPLPPESAAQASGGKNQPRPDPSLVPLLVEGAFFKNRLTIAKTDSIALSIDLVDSLVTLDIRGVPVRECKIQRYSASGALHRARRSPRLGEWLNRPFVLRKEWGTIAKAPIKKVDAPKDTVEAERLANMTPPPDSGDVAFVLEFTRHLTIKVSQAEGFSGKGRLQKFAVLAQHRLASLVEGFADFRRLRQPVPPLIARIELSRADAKAVYRALPRHALLAFRF
ncbi:MAG: hypothetical protein QHJ34_14280 [bacterium]|nr:hypothetical protein [candidate division KSB1 bacterium]MDH7561378.1 hypothetical protein [bacterium]